MKLYAEAMKTCSRCKQEKPFADFGKRAKAADGLHPYCRACVKDSNSRSYAKYADQRRAYANQYRTENIDAVKERQANYREQNRDKAAAASRAWREANPERARAAVADWYVRNPGKAAQYTEKRRATKMAATVEDVDYSVVIAAEGSHCYLCETEIVEGLHMDHVHPLSRGGEHAYYNLRPTHPECNLRKHDMTLVELDLPFDPPNKEGC